LYTTINNERNKNTKLTHFRAKDFYRSQYDVDPILHRNSFLRQRVTSIKSY